MTDRESRFQSPISPLAEGVLLDTQKSVVLRRKISGSLANLSLGQLEQMAGIIDGPRVAAPSRPKIDDDGLVRGSHFEGDFGGGSA